MVEAWLDDVFAIVHGLWSCLLVALLFVARMERTLVILTTDSNLGFLPAFVSSCG